MTQRFSARRALFVLAPAVAVSAAALVASSHAQDASPTTAPTEAPSTQAVYDTASYAIGRQFGTQMRDAPVAVNMDAIRAGFEDAVANRESKYTDEQMEQALGQVQQDMMMQAIQKQAEAAQKTKTEGDAFRAENAKKEGVRTTDSGLQIQTLTPGEGPSPKATDTVRVHYTGTLIDGTKFDSSYDGNEPVSFPLDGVIRGWTEGLQLMKVGEKARLVIPPELAYGDGGAGGVIPPGATLIFEVELLAIEQPEPAGAPQGQ